MTEDQEESIIALAEILNGLHERWTPHIGQIPIGKALFYDHIKSIFVCAGKNFGKTELAAYCSWRWALEHPGSENYIIEPFSIQAKEILWASKRIQTFGPPEHLDGEGNNTEMRLHFKNGSFIKLLGSDNEIALQGIKPKGLIVYDEIKDHRRSAINLMEPNRAAFDVPALFIGTPPEIECYFNDLMEVAKINDDWRFFHAPTSTNPHISRKWLERKRLELIQMGEEETWLRDYEAIFVKGGKRHLVPAFIKMEKKISIPTDPHKWQVFTIFDPAGSSTFGTLIILFNPYTKHHKVWKEIYEQDPQKMTARGIWQQAGPFISELKSSGFSEFEYVYDEAAASFRNEMCEHAPDIWLIPTQKAKTERGEGLSIFRDVITDNLLEVSPECSWFIWEVENYIKDENNRIPKKNDHLIDCYLYFLQAAGFEFKKEQAPKEADQLYQKRFTTIDDEIRFNTNSDAFEFESGSMEEFE